jgi:hypothetical protein
VFIVGSSEELSGSGDGDGDSDASDASDGEPVIAAGDVELNECGRVYKDDADDEAGEFDAGEE